MKITSNAFYLHQTRMTQTKQSAKEEPKQGAVQEEKQEKSVRTAQSKTLTRSEKAENLKNYFWDKYKDYGLTLSSGLTPPKHGVAPSFSIDPSAVEQAANDPQKAKELDEMLSAAVMIDSNWFNAMNHPPEVKVSLSVHINADGTSTAMLRREFSSLEAKNKYGNFDANSFLDEQEELLKKKKSDFDYAKAVGEDSAEQVSEKLWEEHLEDKKWLRQLRNDVRIEEWVSGQREERYFVTGKKNQFVDCKV